uniref:F-box domain-containing protein n=1 Tax=Setaria viridis TaxID=4556 RepID=A0A4U6UK58_SETVI|nr:hypothetical protein SEVIR_5G220000v2 [Setaria viridis]
MDEALAAVLSYLPPPAVLSYLPPPAVSSSSILSSPFPAASPDGEEEDRVGLLPDAILRNIVSRLPIKDAARTAVLSSRWRHIWTSAPIVLDDGAGGLAPAAAAAAALASHPAPSSPRASPPRRTPRSSPLSSPPSLPGTSRTSSWWSMAPGPSSGAFPPTSSAARPSAASGSASASSRTRPAPLRPS